MNIKELNAWMEYMEETKQSSIVRLQKKITNGVHHLTLSLPRDYDEVVELEMSGYQMSPDSLREKFPFAVLKMESKPQSANSIEQEEDSE